MGWYIKLEEKNSHRIIKEEKYGIGWPLLAFDDYDKAQNGVVFEVTGKTAKKNIENIIKHIEDNKNPQNSETLARIADELLFVASRMRDGETYIADYTEAMCVVENPNFDPISFIEEMEDKLEDAIHGFSEFCKKDEVSEQLFAYIDNLSPDIHSSIIWKNTKDYIVIGVGVQLTDVEKRMMATSRITNDNDEYEHRYAQRKLFYILKKAGINCEICRRGAFYYYVIIGRDDAEKWYAEKPYIECSYRLRSTYDIRYYVRNTPAEKEKFYCHAMDNKNIVSVIIDGIELVDSTDIVVSHVIGKTLERGNYSCSDINMKPIR